MEIPQLRRRMPELYYITPGDPYTGSDGTTMTLLDVDSIENLRRNLAGMSPLHRAVLAATLDVVRRELEAAPSTPSW